MTQVSDTIEGNKIIDAFMEVNRFELSDFSWSNTIKYHSSWDWLMPVVEKIETLTVFDGRGEVKYVVSIEANQCIISQGGEGEIEYEQADTKIEATWKCCVQFIQWYNQNKPSPDA